jgi:hypothetical protein
MAQLLRWPRLVSQRQPTDRGIAVTGKSAPSRFAVAATLVATCAIATLHPAVASAEPLLTRNQNPLALPYGLPTPLPARLPSAGPGRFTVDVNWSNSANLESSDDYDFTMDAESIEVRLRLEHAMGSQWAVMIEVPWRNLSGGSLDGFIDNWHDLFGLPQGARRDMPDDRLLIDYQRDGEALLRVDDGSSGIADIPIGAGYQVTVSEERALSAWLTVKLPAGDSDGLLGSGATDVALSIAGETSLAQRWLLFGQVDAVWLGDGDILPQYQESFVWAGLAGVSWNAWRTLDLTVQFQANSQVFDLPVNGLSGDAVVLSYGGSYRTTGGWRFDLGMSEDIEVEASPDATFYFAVQRGF